MTRILFLFPIGLIFGFLLLRVEWNDVYVSMIQEDAIVETLQCLAYFVSSLLALFAGMRDFRKGHSIAGFTLLLGSAFLMFVSLEEISWGQRILGVPTSEWFSQHNFQKEFTVHNLNPVQSVLHYLYVLAGLLLSFGWIPARHLSPGSLLRPEVKTPILLLTPPWYLMPFFLPTFLIYAYFCISEPIADLLGWESFRINHVVIWRDQEPAELLLSLGCLIVVAIAMMNQKKAHWSLEQPEQGQHAGKAA